MKIVFSILIAFIFFIGAVQIVQAKCTDARPASVPILLTPTTLSDTSVTLVWKEAEDPVSYYLIAYGTSETSFEYGIPNIGGKGTTTYTVNALQKGVRYYFKIRAGNGCKPGSFSNKLSIVPGGIDKEEYVAKPPKASFSDEVLGATDSSELKHTSIQEDLDLETLAVEDDSLNDFCISCSAWKYLLIEIIILCLYFLLAKKIYSMFLKPVYSILFPIVIYLFYIRFNNCPSENLSCKYFLFWNFLIFLVIMIIFRQIHIKSYDKK